ncbi:uncharacterized protein [Venturia canescens]|uniref:uncharacterized protein n=1 Tax=Venturia canescens TaxID=32260 RepID=UPI001C9D5FC9|nr:uncharacterized protein LOC122416909 [Venturia canescens]
MRKIIHHRGPRIEEMREWQRWGNRELREKSEQEGRENMDKESDMDGGESREGERAKEREDGIIEDVGQQELGTKGLENERNIEPSMKKRRKRRSPEELAIEEYNKFCSPCYMKVAMNK